MDLTTIIAKNIIRLLDQSKSTQGELSTFLSISRQTLSNYLKGTSTMDCVKLVQTAEFFHVPVTTLLVDSQISKTTMLFRSALNYQDAIDDIEPFVHEYISRYEELNKVVGNASCFLPEQHNLFVDQKGKKISINYEYANLGSSDLTVNDVLERDIIEIADQQRKLLQLNQSGAISLIPALTSRGIKIIFKDFKSDEIYGLSICDNNKGCFIFVNSNSDITIERQLFTIAHEFGHIILHRPLFMQQIHDAITPQFAAFLDKMADKFAGRLLCPPDMLFSYAEQLHDAKNNLRAVLPVAIRIKKRAQVSLQSVMMGLKSCRLINYSVINEFYSMLDATNSRKSEPYPISEDFELFEKFNKHKNSCVLDLIKKAYPTGSIAIKDIVFLLDCDENRASSIISDLEVETDIANVWFPNI